MAAASPASSLSRPAAASAAQSAAAKLSTNQPLLQAIDAEIQAAREETHPSLLQHVLELQERRDEAVHRARENHEARLQQAAHLLEAELKQAEDEFQSSRKQFQEDLVFELQSRRRRVELNLPKTENGMVTRQKGKAQEGKEGKKGAEAAFKGLRVSLLSDEIAADLAMMKKPFSFTQAMLSHIWVDSETLHYNGVEIKLGNSLRCMRSDGLSFSGRVSAVTSVDLHVETDDTRLEVRIWLSHLRSDTWTLLPEHAPGAVAAPSGTSAAADVAVSARGGQQSRRTATPSAAAAAAATAATAAATTSSASHAAAAAPTVSNTAAGIEADVSTSSQRRRPRRGEAGADSGSRANGASQSGVKMEDE